MGWLLTADTREFLAAAGEFLRADPVRNTVILTVTENLRVRAVARLAAVPARPSAAAPGPDAPLFGWWRPPGAAVTAAFLHTPGMPLLLTPASEQAAAGLARDLAASVRRVPGIQSGQEATAAFAAAWQDRTGDAVTVHRRQRLFRLGELTRPEPGPAGTARLAAGGDRDLMAEWFHAFAREIGDPPGQDHHAAVDARLGYGGLMVWEASGAPVSIAGLTRAVAGMVRVGSVYTPPRLRGRGYAAAVTAAASQAALDAGVRDVVLYTDLANPASNALYQRLGYRPVQDCVVLSFGPAAHGLRFAHERTRGLRPAGRR